ncbi:hypothetical protein Ddc_12518 [Ditylenchus destructor]|nr:hypothetical protein Ddc_12518 [Ditylenchus destructor]
MTSVCSEMAPIDIKEENLEVHKVEPDNKENDLIINEDVNSKDIAGESEDVSKLKEEAPADNLESGVKQEVEPQADAESEPQTNADATSEPQIIPAQITPPKWAIFKLNISSFRQLIKGTDKAFSDLTYIGGLPWQIFAMAENNYIDEDNNDISLLANTNSQAKHRLVRQQSSISSKSCLSVYLLCNGKMAKREFEFGGETSKAYVIVPSTVKNGKDIVCEFSATFNERDYLAKINVGKVEQFFSPGFVKIDGSLQLMVKIDAQNYNK